MDLNEINALDNNSKEKYMAYQHLFGHKAYPMLTSWAKQNIDECQQRMNNATTWDTFLVNRGGMIAFSILLNLESSVENEFLAVAEEAVAAKNAEVEAELE